MMSELSIQVLEISLRDTLVGYLSHYQGGKNIFVFAESYIELGVERPTLSLSFEDLQRPYVSTTKLPTFFSNLLPEGALREYITEQLGIHYDHEFQLLKALSNDLPGAIQIKAINYVPEEILQLKKAVDAKPELTNAANEKIHFSLAGVQIKFSMLSKHGGRFFLGKNGELGDYIIKTPSIIYENLPENEFSMMSLAKLVGVNVPEVSLVDMSRLENLPILNLPRQQKAYTIKRFDREQGGCVHIEDFAQVFGVRSHQKYSKTNYDSMGRLIKGLLPADDLKQFIQRLVVDILIGNTDAHLKNWSLIYRDAITPELAPSYDLVSSLAYINNRDLALNLARVKHFYDIDRRVLEKFSEHINIEKSWLLSTIEETVSLARERWPSEIKYLPINSATTDALKAHWKNLNPLFQL
jgi:serine/threonine-protein kinase HipA